MDIGEPIGIGMPPNSDVKGQKSTLKSAAKNGIPLVEKCEKNKRKDKKRRRRRKGRGSTK